jgi:hypothetical protein
VCLLALAAVAAGRLDRPSPLPAGQAVRQFDFSTWHFPVPGGDWLISRGPCEAGWLYFHPCDYYEDACALDIVPVSGNMQSVPVLAPQDGQVFFAGTRTDTGLAVMLRHADGRISTLMHLSKVVVGLDENVIQGQVLGYAGSTGYSGQPHVHFDVQPNAVERTCLPITGIDEINRRMMTLVSHNSSWSALSLPDPPASLPVWLPLVGVPEAAPSVIVPARVELAPAAQAAVPVAVAIGYLGTQNLLYDDAALSPVAQTNGFYLYRLPIAAPSAPGDYAGSLQFQVAGPVMGAPPATFHYSVRAPVDTSASAGLIWIYPKLVSPPYFSVFSAAPNLCFSEQPQAGAPPLRYRILLTGAGQADSGWMAAMCWTPPQLEPGTYYWKVFVRDSQGHMNRTNDRPYFFTIQ